MNIAFWTPQLCERGTSISLYDYAYYNQILLNNKSFIFYEKNNQNNNLQVINKFNKQFIVNPLINFEETEHYINKYDITHIYIIKYGLNDLQLSKIAKNCIHCVFDCGQPHGEIYTSISNKVFNYNNNIKVVPHMINLPNHPDEYNMREELNIPKNAVIFGGYGGKYSFNITWVQLLVYEVAKYFPNIYFLFANFAPFCLTLPNIIHLSTIIDTNEKVKFINTCDAMLWARMDGESFGISIGEFSSKNKPIIATATNIGYTAHVEILKDKAIWYNDKESLLNILLSFNPEIEKKKDWNAYKDYTPEKVMKIFNETYLQ